MEKISLIEYLFKSGKQPLGKYRKHDNGQLMTIEEWDEFFKEKFGK